MVSASPTDRISQQKTEQGACGAKTGTAKCAVCTGRELAWRSRGAENESGEQYAGRL